MNYLGKEITKERYDEIHSDEFHPLYEYAQRAINENGTYIYYLIL